MKSKKYSVIVSTILMASSIFVFTFLNFRMYPTEFKEVARLILGEGLSDWRNYGIVISSGVFTSSLVTLMISVSEYRIERRNALEDYCEANYRFMHNFHNLDYLDIDIPWDLLKKYYGEICHSYFLEEDRKGYIYNDEYIELDSDAKKNIMNYIWENTSDITKRACKEPYKKMEYMEREFKRKIEDYDLKIEKVMKQYIELGDILERGEISNTYGRIDFLFSNRKWRNKVLYHEIYEKQSDVMKQVKLVQYQLKVGSENKAILLDYINKIQTYLFSVSEDERSIGVYKEYLYNMNCALNKVLKFTYGSNYKDRQPNKKDFLCLARFKR